MKDGYLERYIRAKLRKGGDEDRKAAGYAALLRKEYGDETDNHMVGSREGMRKFYPVETDHGPRLGVETDGDLRVLMPSETRFLTPLVDNLGQIVTPQDVIKSMTEGPVSESYASVTYKRVREKLETNPTIPRHVFMFKYMGFMLVGFDPSGFMEYAEAHPEMLKPRKRM